MIVINSVKVKPVSIMSLILNVENLDRDVAISRVNILDVEESVN